MKLALITGATGGLGKALAALLAEKKIPLLLTARHPDQLEQLSKSLRQKTEVTWIAADLAKDPSPVLQAIEEKAPDLIINNAGFGLYGAVTDLSGQGEMIDLNCKALLFIAQKAAQTLLAKGEKGTILNIASTTAFFEIPYFAAYCATKAFVRSFSLAMAEELAPHGIHVLVSCPGQIATPFRLRAAHGAPQKKDNISCSPDLIAKLLWKQIEQGKRCTVIDWRYRLFMIFFRLLPRQWLQRKLARAILKRTVST